MANLTIVNYHYVRDMHETKYPGIKGFLIKYFKFQVDYLSKKFNMISMSQYVDYLNGNGEIPENSCLLTFDDGLKDHYENVYPVLKEKGISGMFYLISQTLTDFKVPHVHKVHFLLDKLGSEKIAGFANEFFKSKGNEVFEKYRIHGEFRINPKRRFDDNLTANLKQNLGVMPFSLKDELLNDLFSECFEEEKFCKELFLSEEEVKEMMENGMEFGSHSHFHKQLASLSEKEQEEEFVKSTEILRDKFGKIDSFSYPNGSYTEEAIEMLKKLNYVSAVTVELKENEGKVNPFKIARFDANDFPKE
ncbi:polysaccharide deacetylase family protein [Candidatus Woesearchaeota archaeon]|jgi:peptidoglycan/xylan/chitin deacetylase (PgdA/CDA1 family)|nr:polysaccharide deacetylase family protein [Candidatus Woesearchaeota archaeon]MBT4322100.1 polysaccharide deacetylase family protein [Candidatus Woesearchaeota archaeon]MBT4630677.1 polysaccharide deacetylase family protein [Candidatus Woesearchaeota archaeon]